MCSGTSSADCRRSNFPPPTAYRVLFCMGIYDREYYRDEPRGYSLGGDWSAVTTLMVINVAVFLADAFSSNHWIARTLSLDTGDLFHQPWNVWQLLTYGFVHDPRDIWHLAFNMLGLWVFGRDVELVYGAKSFTKCM